MKGRDLRPFAFAQDRLQELARYWGRSYDWRNACWRFEARRAQPTYAHKIFSPIVLIAAL